MRSGRQSSAGTDTGDVERPRVVWMTPFDNAINVPTNAVFNVQIDEPINPLTVDDDTLLLIHEVNTPEDDFDVEVSGARTVSADGRTLRFVPDEPLHGGARYRFETRSDIHDLVGNLRRN